MSNPSSTKVHARIDHDRALCGLTPRNGHAGAIKAFAEQFSRAAFETKWRAFVEEAYANRHRHSEHL